MRVKKLPKTTKKRQNLQKQNIKQTTGKTYQYSADKYLLYGLDIAVYLESSIATGAMKQNIQTLVKESIPEIQDCDECLRFETMNMSASG